MHRMWAGFIWLRLGISGSLVNTVMKLKVETLTIEGL
jgi:hypothetical protein